MRRFKWYRAGWPAPIRDLARRLQEKTFQRDSSDGFVLDRVREDYVEGRFIERIEVQEHTTDPFGEQLQFDRVEFRQLGFRVSDARPGLEIIGSSSGSIALVNRLAEATNFRLAVTNCAVDVLKWLSVFRERSGFAGYVDIMQIGKIDLGGGAVARAIVRGKEDVSVASTALTGGRPFMIEKVQFRLAGPEKGSITFSSGGSVTVRVTDDARIIESIRASLQELEAAPLELRWNK